MRRRRREIASRGRRLAAGALDGLIMVGLGSLGMLAWSKLPRIRKRPSTEPAEVATRETPGGDDAAPAGSSQAWPVTSSAVSIGLEIGLRNWRSPGARLLGIRRVDASTGGPLSIRSVIIHQLVARLLTAPSTEIFRRMWRREADRLQQLAPRVAEIEQEHAGDPQALQRALKAFYSENEVTPFRSCLLPLVGPFAVNILLTWPAKKQTLPERLAGIIVVRID